jgi:hypothetical protein
MSAMTRASDRLACSGGKAGSAARRRMMRTVRRNFTRSGSMPASVAAWQISAEMA